MNTYERTLMVKAASRIDDLHQLVKAASLKEECIKMAMEMVASGDLAPFNSYEELEQAAERIAGKDPEVVKQAMAIVKSRRAPSLGKLVESDSGSSDTSGLDKSEQRFIDNLRTLTGGL